MASVAQLLIALLASTAAATDIPGYLTTYEVLTEGTGAETVSKGQHVTVHATGVVKESGYKS